MSEAQLTHLQLTVLDELRERECFFVAEAAKAAWLRNCAAFMDDRVRCPGWLRRLFAKANHQAEKGRRT